MVEGTKQQSIGMQHQKCRKEHNWQAESPQKTYNKLAQRGNAQSSPVQQSGKTLTQDTVMRQGKREDHMKDVWKKREQQKPIMKGANNESEQWQSMKQACKVPEE